MAAAQEEGRGSTKIRLLVKTTLNWTRYNDRDQDEAPIICSNVDTKDFDSILFDISHQIGYEVDRIWLVIFDQFGIPREKGKCTKPGDLRDNDIVFVERREEEEGDYDDDGQYVDDHDHHDNVAQEVTDSSVASNNYCSAVAAVASATTNERCSGINSDTDKKKSANLPSSVSYARSGSARTSAKVANNRRNGNSDLDDDGNEQEADDKRDDAAKNNHSVRRQQRTYPLHTKVREYFGGYGWYNGTIDAINNEEKYYNVKWTDGTFYSYSFKSRKIDKIVQQYKKWSKDDQGEDPGGRKDDNSGKEDDAGVASSPSSTEDSDFKIHRPSKKQKKLNGKMMMTKAAKSKNSPNRGNGSSPGSCQAKYKTALLTDEQLNRLVGIEFNIDEFRTYLVDEALADNYITLIVGKIAKLQDRIGIRHNTWPTGIVFCCSTSRPFDMGTDFCKIYKDAVDFEAKYGDDPSHGNGLKIPISKLMMYQEYFYWNKRPEYSSVARLPANNQVIAKSPTDKTKRQSSILNFVTKSPDRKLPAGKQQSSVAKLPTDKQRESSVAKLPADKEQQSSVAKAPSDEQRESSVAKALPDERRKQLAGQAFDINDFRAYLESRNLGKGYIKNILRAVRKLRDGIGIGSTHWNFTTFQPSIPVTDMSTNFHQMRKEAICFEETQIDNNGIINRNGIVLRVPLQKLIDYQAYYYNHGRVLEEVSNAAAQSPSTNTAASRGEESSAAEQPKQGAKSDDDEVEVIDVDLESLPSQGEESNEPGVKRDVDMEVIDVDASPEVIDVDDMDDGEYV